MRHHHQHFKLHNELLNSVRGTYVYYVISCVFCVLHKSHPAQLLHS